MRSTLMFLLFFSIGFISMDVLAEEPALFIRPEIGEAIRLDKSTVFFAKKEPNPHLGILIMFNPEVNQRLNEMTSLNLGKKVEFVFGDQVISHFVTPIPILWTMIQINASSEAQALAILKAMGQ